MTKTFSLQALADALNATLLLRGGRSAADLVVGLAPLSVAGAQHLSFLHNSKYRRYLPMTQAAAVIIAPNEQQHCPESLTCLLTENPYFAYAKVATMFSVEPAQPKGIAISAVIGKNLQIADSASVGPQVVIGNDVKIGENSIIFPGCYIGDNSTIGDDCILYPSVTLYHGSILHNRVILHAGVVIGADGFGIAEHEGGWFKIPQLGRVVLHDAVEVGAQTTIDRGALGDTVLHCGVKLDNHIQIGHNVEIGEHTVIAACSGVSGSTKIGRFCKISGMVGVIGHAEIADGVVITGMTKVSKSLKRPGIYSSGTAVESHASWRKNATRFRQLDDLARRIALLEARLKAEE